MFESYESTGEAYEGEAYELPGEAGVLGEAFESMPGEGESLEGELAQRLLEVTTEAELDRFLGDIARSVVKGASSFIKSPVGKALGGVLKNVAKKALPVVGGAVGSFLLPGAGTAIGSKLGSLAGGLLEAGEAETMGEAEAQYEAAQRYVRFARASMGMAARAPRDVPPWSVARAATTTAARRYAPGLLRGDRTPPWRQRRRPSDDAPAWGGWQPYPGWGPAPPWTTDPGPGPGDPYADGGQDLPLSWESPSGGAPAGAPSRPQAVEGRWVRRGHRIVVLGA